MFLLVGIVVIIEKIFIAMGGVCIKYIKEIVLRDSIVIVLKIFKEKKIGREVGDYLSP